MLVANRVGKAVRACRKRVGLGVGKRAQVPRTVYKYLYEVIKCLVSMQMEGILV